MAIELLCRKIGMTRIFTETGDSIAVTVLEAGPNPVVQKKTVEKDGYSALQLGFGEKRRTTAPKAILGHFAKAGVAPKRHLGECRISPEEAAGYEVGQDVKVDVFKAGERIDVIGTSRGRGTAAGSRSRPGRSAPRAGPWGSTSRPSTRRFATRT